MSKHIADGDVMGRLYIVATPIGNLEDITLRALRILRECDYVLCEDTRVTATLLNHYDIKKKKKRYDTHTSDSVHQEIICDLKRGLHIALVSDAGTPCISDPGVRLVEQVRNEGVVIEAVPGPSSVTAAVSIAGLSGNQFTFLGFVPQKKGRDKFFNNLFQYEHPVVFFESTHRIMKTLESLSKLYNDRELILVRELTKYYEDLMVDHPSIVYDKLLLEPIKQKGEFVLILRTL